MAERDRGPLRADARRNRERLLEAATAVFAEQGLHAQTQDIARRAGVGVGTLFRHFPTKQALIQALSVGQMRAAVGQIEAALAETDDPGGAFDRLIGHFVSQHADYRALGDTLALDEDGNQPLRGRLFDGLATLVRRAQENGQMRPDVNVQDVLLLLAACAHTAEATAARGAGPYQRFTQVMLDGLRTKQPTPLPEPADGEHWTVMYRAGHHHGAHPTRRAHRAQPGSADADPHGSDQR